MKQAPADRIKVLHGTGKKNSEPTVALPVPEVVTARGGRFDVKGGDVAKVDLVHRTMEVPTGATSLDRRARSHELSHVRWTPRDGYEQADARGLPRELCNAVEDCRINAHARRAGVPQDAPYELGELGTALAAGKAPKGWDPATFAGAMTIASHGTANERGVVDAVREGHPEHVEAFVELAETVAAPDAGFDVTLDVTETLYEAAAGSDEGGGGPDSEPTPGSGTGTDLPPLPMMMGARPKDGDAEPSVAAMIENERAAGDLQLPDGTSEMDRVAKGVRGIESDSLYGAGQWCRMETREPRRTVRLPKGRGRGRRSMDVGRVPTKVHRTHIDRRIFTSRHGARAFSGSVLLDVSGSMDLTPEHIAAIIDAYPAGVVAHYCSDGYRTGWLTVVARDGRRVGDGVLIAPGGGNGVDGPALEWLARQPRPRYWVCDGGITGQSDILCNRKLAGQVKRLCASKRIMRVPYVDQIPGCGAKPCDYCGVPARAGRLHTCR